MSYERYDRCLLHVSRGLILLVVGMICFLWGCAIYGLFFTRPSAPVLSSPVQPATYHYLLLQAMLQRPGGPTQVYAGPGQPGTINAQPAEIPLIQAAVLLQTDNSLRLSSPAVQLLLQAKDRPLAPCFSRRPDLPLQGDIVVWVIVGECPLTEEAYERLTPAVGEHWLVKEGGTSRKHRPTCRLLLK
jgi:hypothetical protein